jgi:hypothetical protein
MLDYLWFAAGRGDRKGRTILLFRPRCEAVLPAYLVGLVVAGVFLRDKTLVHRMRSIASRSLLRSTSSALASMSHSLRFGRLWRLSAASSFSR